jgi:hypothetical protein
MKSCHECNGRIPRDDIYCPHCGRGPKLRKLKSFSNWQSSHWTAEWGPDGGDMQWKDLSAYLRWINQFSNELKKNIGNAFYPHIKVDFYRGNLFGIDMRADAHSDKVMTHHYIDILNRICKKYNMKWHVYPKYPPEKRFVYYGGSYDVVVVFMQG